MIKTLSKILISLTLLSFVFVALLGLNTGMNKGSMSDCPFDEGSSSICDMNPFEHIMKWNQIFTASFNSYFEQILALLALIIISAIVAFSTNLFKENIFYFRKPLAIYIDPPNSKIFDYRVLDISKGIIRALR